MNNMQTPYEKDPYAWSQEQAAFLRSGQFRNLDVDHLAEELESLMASDKRALRGFIRNLLLHELKKKYQPEKATKSWDQSIFNAHDEIEILLKDNPSFKRLVPGYIKDEYIRAKRNAIFETELDEKIFPKECPWTIEEVLGTD
jgi:hypothetical protein